MEEYDNCIVVDEVIDGSEIYIYFFIMITV